MHRLLSKLAEKLALNAEGYRIRKTNRFVYTTKKLNRQ